MKPRIIDLSQAVVGGGLRTSKGDTFNIKGGDMRVTAA